MLRKAETLEGMVIPQIGDLRTRETGSAGKSSFGWDDDHDIDEICNETLTIIRLLTTESPTFGSE